jgi:lycopene beta-cyclase
MRDSLAGSLARQMPISPFYLFLIGAWMLVMLSMPIVVHFFGEPGLMAGIMAGVMLQVGVVLAVLYAAWGFRRTLLTSLGVIGLAWFAEAVGSATGFPFGAYAYTARLQPQLAHVPLLIPLAWLMMLPPAWAIAARVVGQSRGVRFVLASALAFTAWDLFLDPQMVAWDLWVWAEPGGYFGIPWLNFLGWLLVSGLITALVRPANLPDRPFLFIYIITWLLSTIGLAIFWDLPGPALAGFVAMGIMIWWALTAPGRRTGL